MNFFQNVRSVWKSLRSAQRKSPVRASRRLAPIEALEVRTLLAGEFSELPALGFTPASYSSVAWGDADGDGDLDAVVTGMDTGGPGGNFMSNAKVYRNNGNNTYTDLNAGLRGVLEGSVAWGDVDNDGDLDILLTGRDAGNDEPIAKVYLNGGGGTFTEAANTGLTGIRAGSIAWGDYDNDGHLDVLLSGGSATGASISKVYHNNGNNTFTAINSGIEVVGISSVAWGDFDNDGNRDIVIAGLDLGNAKIAKVYHNNGNGTFTDLNVGLTGVNDASIAVGDADNDGKLDILLTGRDSGANYITKLYHNNGNNSFSDLNAGLTGVDRGSASFGDADNDGDLDILLTGSGPIAKVYRNNGNNTFTDLNAGLTGVSESSAAWGDADNDGDLDILLSGTTMTYLPTGGVTKFYRNNATTLNTAPNAPTNLQSSLASTSGLTFTWAAATDPQTPSAGLSYNLRVGTTPGGSDVFATMSDTDANGSNGANGLRRLPAAGPIQGTSYTLQGLDPTRKYYWSVQAVDTAFAGSPFAAEQTAVGLLTDLGSGGIADVNFSSVAWGDYDNDGDLDALVTGNSSASVYVSRVYRNDGNNAFTDLGAGLVGVSGGSVDWGDYDNDGNLDILLSGFTSSSTRTSRIYHNNGNGTFTDIAAGLTGVGYSSVGWGDVDSDGDLDVLISGSIPNETRQTRVYRNTGGSFAEILNTGLPRIKKGSVAWGDADNDGYPDVLITGNTTGDNLIAEVFHNNGDGTCSNVNAGLPGVYQSSVAWGDYDNDGKLDILLTGKDASNAYVSRVYHNDGNNVFSDSGATLTGIAYGSATWGDVNNDGKLDILVAGFDTANTKITKVYRNAGGNSFTDYNAGFSGIGYSSAAWGDIDNDGKLDILVSGSDNSADRVTKIYHNNVATVNTAPAFPSNLTSSFPTTTSLTLNWNAPADAQTPAGGLSYNLRVGTTPGGSDVFATMANTASGARRLPAHGPIQGTSFTLNGLTAGQSYYWSVQAIDTSFTGGAFAFEQNANSSNFAPVVSGAVANQPVNDNATISPFSTLTVTDPDNQNMFARVTILNGAVRGDFTAGSVTGWNRIVTGNDIKYERFYSPQANIANVLQAAIRAFVFQPRTNAIKPNTTEATAFSIYVTDGINNVTNNTTTVITTSLNNAPSIGGASTNHTVNDNATINPFPTLTVSDVDTQEMLISVTILNGRVRGDFTPASTTGWAARYTVGNDIVYKRYFSPGPNVGATAQAAFRALVFQPRTNAITPGTTELTDFQVTASDGVAPAVLGPNSRLTTTSVNNVPVIGGAAANQTMNDSQTKAVFSTLTVTDPDTQNILARVTINNGTAQGDFTNASSAGWTRSVSGGNIVYTRYFNPVANIGATVQTAIRSLIFQPRNNVPIATQETTTFTVFINDGIANTTNSTTSVITTGVAPRVAPPATPVTAPLILASDTTTIVLPTVSKPRPSLLDRLSKKSR